MAQAGVTYKILVTTRDLTRIVRHKTDAQSDIALQMNQSATRCRDHAEEVFGPLLPIIAYDSLPGAAEKPGKLARPLAMYFIRGTAAEKEFILKNTYAGGISFVRRICYPFGVTMTTGQIINSQKRLE